jgi:beta-galactosidase
MPPDFPLLELAGQKNWKMPQLPCLGKLPPQAPVLPYTNPEDSLRLIRTTSPWLFNLDSTLDFKILPGLKQVSAEAINQGAWSTSQVPANSTMQGFGHPHYSNIIAVHELRLGIILEYRYVTD